MHSAVPSLKTSESLNASSHQGLWNLSLITYIKTALGRDILRASEERQQAWDDPDFMSRIITCDESCGYNYDPATKQQYKRTKSQRPKKEHQVRSPTKSMLVLWHSPDCSQYVCPPRLDCQC